MVLGLNNYGLSFGDVLTDPSGTQWAVERSTLAGMSNYMLVKTGMLVMSPEYHGPDYFDGTDLTRGGTFIPAGHLPSYI
jgi:hypothetical protein